MSALLNTLDNITSLQNGKNGHVEFSWSNNIKEKIVQFHFQLIRTDEEGIKNLQLILKDILLLLKHNINFGCISKKQIAKEYLTVIYCLIGQTRDIIDGKGEYNLAYMMIYTLYDFYPSLAKFALKCFVQFEDENIHPYGSWKDIKYFCRFCKNNSLLKNSDHPLIEYALQLINKQLKNDYNNYLNKKNISLLAKWIPREKSSFGYLYQNLAINYFDNYLNTAKTDIQLKKAILKCKTEYRKLLSLLNNEIETLQIKQCSQQWSKINFDKVTSISIAKQKKAFLNINKNGEVRFPFNNDRIECCEHFKSRIKNTLINENINNDIKGERISMADFTKQALELISNPNQDEIDLLNSQWRNNSLSTNGLGKMIAMIDVSQSMIGDPMNVAIALGIRIANKSIFGKRVMTFSNKPSWINLELHEDFVSQVEVIRRADWGLNTNLYAALDIILDSIIQSKLNPSEVSKMILVILSDMQIDKGDNSDKKTLYETMTNKYKEAGIRIFGKPLLPPHIVFWNLRSTSGFPSLSNHPNCSMVSGFSPNLLNQFCENGINAIIQSCNPWTILTNILENDRYKILSNYLKEEIPINEEI